MNNNHLKGFSFVELLVAMAIFSIIGSATVSVLFATLRAGRKSDTLVSLRQNGNAVLSQVVKNIRYAKSLDNPSSCVPSINTSSLTVTSILDNSQTTFACVQGAASAVTSNGIPLTDTSTTIVTNCSFICSQATINDSPAINIKFTLNSKNTSGLFESSGAIPFQSSVILRNYNR